MSKGGSVAMEMQYRLVCGDPAYIQLLYVAPTYPSTSSNGLESVGVRAQWQLPDEEEASRARHDVIAQF